MSIADHEMFCFPTDPIVMTCRCGKWERTFAIPQEGSDNEAEEKLIDEMKTAWEEHMREVQQP